ncbi:non-hydrolyzing UDP-N-acetylglucosamine 2-epimerase [Bacillus infantis]|uniref:UDP-N-acetylglucosamine 2-epimerase (Non-hydrolyzing) n=1 Tax=Bacillus infantis TaxID=324767 RepID=A0A5D4RCE7_9BACI|nr:UDP-N-acetylglucosamine 2-epimerase (non-hydrolyzing) [Bacillus infantis]TYS48021.1 UDP-N-acetylglucosamine 2-epimerase (non-hydrolyzing) [Bacillus infantis]
MKVMTILGTRPEIIRLSLIINKLDQLCSRHILVHTGQNFTGNLSDVFFQEMKVRKPDFILLGKQHSLGEQLSAIFSELEKIILAERPDRVLVLGDTNSGLGAIIAERMGVPVIHMEAGNRCFDLEVPEEKNRKVIDAISTYNLPYTPQSRENLLREGIPSSRIIVSGNPIYEVLEHYKSQIDHSSVLEGLKLEPGGYFLATIHRAENVDRADRLIQIMKGLNLTAEKFKVRIICSIHPRTRSKLSQIGALEMNPLVEFHEPFGFFDFVKLEKNAFGALTDSGTVQEECCLFHVPAVTIRKTTERPETIECGSNMVSGLNAENILRCVEVMAASDRKWSFPIGYEEPAVSDKVIKILMGGMENV